MPMKTTKQQLVELLATKDTKVIALTGRWGTGKSHLWREVQESSDDEATKAALYVSLFGVKSIQDIKFKAVQKTLQQKNGAAKWKEKVVNGIENLARFMKHFHKGGTDALGEITQMSAPSILGDSVIVLDDMERKHKDLQVDEILGFVDEFSCSYGCRFILIFNVDKLGVDINIWEEMREKVIDHELQLQTTPEEAFDIARRITLSKYADAIRKATVACGITNIRIIKKIIRSTNLILDSSETISDAIIARTVPSIVLIAAIHYKGIDDPPSFNYIQSYGELSQSAELLESKLIALEIKIKEDGWAKMMRSMNFSGSDHFEPLVKRFLETGTFGDSEIKTILAKYIANQERAKIISAAEALKFRITWDAATSNTEIISLSRDLTKDIFYLGPGQVSAFYDHVASLPNAHDVAEGIIDAWVTKFNQIDSENSELDAFYAPVKGYHSKVIDACIKARRLRPPQLTIFTALEKIANSGSWGGEQEFLNSCSIEEFKHALKNSGPAERRLIVIKMLEMGLNRAAYAGFNSSIETFLAACTEISADPTSGRLGKIIADRLKIYKSRGGN